MTSSSKSKKNIFEHYELPEYLLKAIEQYFCANNWYENASHDQIDECANLLAECENELLSALNRWRGELDNSLATPRKLANYKPFKPVVLPKNTLFRAVDTLSGWVGPERKSLSAAKRDAIRHENSLPKNGLCKIRIAYKSDDGYAHDAHTGRLIFINQSALTWD